jgi:3-phytase
MHANRLKFVLGLVCVACPVVSSLAGDEMTRLTPAARVQTEPVPSNGDAADDPAIWIHPTDPAQSLVLGTDKKGGLHAYSLDGRDRQLISPQSRPNNVDIIYDFQYKGRKIDLAVATVGKGSRASGVKVWTIASADGTLAELGAGPTFHTFDGGLPYGICGYRSPRDRSVYIFVTDRSGAVEQYKLTSSSAASGTGIEARRVRSFAIGSQAEGIVADRERGKLFIAEEDAGIWEYGAEPGDGATRRPVARVGEHGLAADVEGLALYYAAGGKGYLLASSQGAGTVMVYDRAGDHAYVATIDPKAGATDDVAETDGLDVTNERTSAQFPRGLFVMQDGKNEGRQNFKLFAWDDVAGGRLLVDGNTSCRATPVPAEGSAVAPR